MDPDIQKIRYEKFEQLRQQSVIIVKNARNKIMSEGNNSKSNIVS